MIRIHRSKCSNADIRLLIKGSLFVYVRIGQSEKTSGSAAVFGTTTWVVPFNRMVGKFTFAGN